MSRTLDGKTSLDSLKKEARRWLRALRASDEQARARMRQAFPAAPAAPGLRDVQHAIALEHGVPSWAHLKARLADERRRRAAGDRREQALVALLSAADTGDATRVAEIADAHPDVIDERGLLQGHTGLRTALHFGVEHAPVVRALLDRGANPNIRDEGDNAFPLHFAAERQDLEVIRLLVEHGADPIGAGDDHELEVIGWATAFDYLSPQLEVVDYLLAHGARHNILSAVTLGDVEAIRALAARMPAEINRRMDRTNHRRRPVHLAIVKKQPAALAALLDLGADLDAADAAGLTALDQAAMDGETAMARLLIDRGATVSLPAAVALGRTEDIDRLLREDPNCLRPGHRWGHLIVRASERASAEVIELLIRYGASVNVADAEETAIDGTSGYTPLHAAASRGNAGAVVALLKHGANPSIRDSKYLGTPAGWANYFHHADVRDLILAGPIDLFEALDFDRLDRIADILARDPAALERPFREYASARTSHDRLMQEPWCTPLAWAVMQNKAAAVRQLLAHGARRSVSPDGRTLEDLAAEPGREQAAEALKAPDR